MRIRPTLIAAAAAVTIGGASIIGVNAASAETPGDTLVEKIATRFNLNKDEVQKVFEEDREARQAEREAEMSERLQQKVADGIITSEQKDALETKLKEMREQHESQEESGLTKEERHQLRQQQHDELQAWADEQGIPLDQIMPLGGPRGGAGHIRESSSQ